MQYNTIQYKTVYHVNMMTDANPAEHYFIQFYV